MNSEQIIQLSSELINKWQREEDTACSLYVANGKVCCEAKGSRWVTGPTCLNITQWQVRHGLISSKWERLGNELLNELNKELACQAHQKP